MPNDALPEALAVHYATDQGHEFEVHLHGFGSRVKMDGVELRFVRSVKIEQPLDSDPIVIIEFLAKSVTGIGET